MSPTPTDETQENVPVENRDKPATPVAKFDEKPQWARDFLAVRRDGYLKRTQEIVCLSLAWPMLAIHLYMLYEHFTVSRIFPIFVTAVLGIATADFIGGFLHWLGDTWGSVNAPILGKLIIQMLRVHHYDLTDLIDHDFLTINADNFGLLLPFLIPCTRLYLYSSPAEIAASYNLISYLFFLSFFGSWTTQFHKWSHMYTGLPPFVSTLQRLHLALPRHNHAQHHQHPKRHASHFCLTVGWMNYPLEYFDFWGKLEYIVESVTGVKPRSVDYY